MNETLIVMNAVIPVFGIIVLGLLLRRFQWLTEEADRSLLRVNINVLFPCLVLDAALGNPALSKASNLVLAPLIGFGTVAFGMILANFGGRCFGMERRSRHTFAVTTGIYNYSYIPLPLAMLLFPGGSTVGVLFLHNVGVELAMWTLGVMLLGRHQSSQDTTPYWRRLVNAPLIAIVAALVLNWTGAFHLAPPALLTGIHWLGQCAIPMALLLIGAVVADFLPEFTSQRSFPVIGGACLLRLGILPLGFLLLAVVIPATPELKQVMILEAAMPAAVFPVVMAKQYGGDPATALRVVLGTSIFGLMTIPLWIRAGMHWLGISGAG